MRESGHKGDGKRLVGYLVWLPLVVALVVQYGLAASLLGANGKASDAAHVGAPSVTYEVSVTPNGQVLSSSAKGDASVATASPDSSKSSAAEAFLQAAEENNAVSALRDEERSVLQSARERVTRELAIAKVQKRQTNKERADKLRIGSLLKQAEGLKGLKVRGYDISEERMVKLVDKSPSYTSDIEYIDQNDLLPSGCEIVALTVALHSMGYDDADAVKIADKYVEYGSDSAKYFTGSPYRNGGGFPPCIVDAANKWLKDNGGGAEAYNLTGSSFESLCALVELGYPVLVWTTDSMSEPYVGSDWYQPEHCVVMYGTEIADEQKEVSDSEKKSGDNAVRDNAASQEKSTSSASASSQSASASSASASLPSESESSSSASSATTEAAIHSASSSSASAGSSAAARSASASGSMSSSASAAAKSSSSAASAKSGGSAGSSSSAASTRSEGSTGSSSNAASSRSSDSVKNSGAASPKSSDSAGSPSSAASSKSANATSSSSSASSSSASASPAPAYTYVKVSDSLAGLVKRDYSDFKRIYEKAGKRALFIQPD